MNPWISFAVSIGVSLLALWRSRRLSRALDRNSKKLTELADEHEQLATKHAMLRAAVIWAAEQGVVIGDPDELVETHRTFVVRQYLGGLYKRPVQ